MLKFKKSLNAKVVTVHDKMQKKYRYQLTEPLGKNFDPRFKPELTPKQMLKLGVFGGKYMTDCRMDCHQAAHCSDPEELPAG
jgi:hypothetical protein